MSDDVLLRRLYYEENGQWMEARYYGRRVVWVGPAPVLLLHLCRWPWRTQEPPSLALVKEGPKAIILYRGAIAARQPCILA
jgi:hypothetical protein